ncbi:hypothetical protein ACFVX3_31125 [Rhodococcus erythropolis]
MTTSAPDPFGSPGDHPDEPAVMSALVGGDGVDCDGSPHHRSLLDGPGSPGIIAVSLVLVIGLVVLIELVSPRIL